MINVILKMVSMWLFSILSKPQLNLNLNTPQLKFNTYWVWYDYDFTLPLWLTHKELYLLSGGITWWCKLIQSLIIFLGNLRDTIDRLGAKLITKMGLHNQTPTHHLPPTHQELFGDIARRRTSSYNVAKLFQMASMDFWRNYTPFFGVAAFFTTKNCGVRKKQADHFRP